MGFPANVLISVGGLLLLGLAIDALAGYLRLPRVTLLIILGFLVGPAAFNLLPLDEQRWFLVFADMALVMVGFLLGEKFTRRALQKRGRQALGVSIMVAVGTALVVFPGLYLLGAGIEVSLLLAAIATATAPAATLDVIRENRSKGSFTDLLVEVVALDDAWGLILFSIALALAHAIPGGTGAFGALLTGGRELGGAILLGVLIGIPTAYLTGRVKKGEPMLVEALGVVLLCGGIAIWLEVSFILASVVLGGVVANFAKHHKYPFHAIEQIEWPFMVLFFVFAGASMEVYALMQIGIVGLAYILLRIAGRIAGGWAGAWFSNADSGTRRWVGVALMPQAGVALGMALIASERFPDLQEVIMPLVVGSTVLFEILGPICTRVALGRSGETAASSG